MWEKIKAWFKDSETIFWARLQVFVGVVVSVLTVVVADPNAIAAVHAMVEPKYVPLYLIGFGVLTELLRRYRADDL